MAAPHGLRDVLELVPAVRYAFAYGSAVLTQPGLYRPQEAAGQLVDFVMAVDNTTLWHEQVTCANQPVVCLLYGFFGSGKWLELFTSFGADSIPRLSYRILQGTEGTTRAWQLWERAR